MRGKILDINNIETLVQLEDEQIISIPTYKIENSKLGDCLYISNIYTNNPYQFKNNQYINPISKLF